MNTDKIVDGEKLDADLTSVADAIRAKNGTKDMLSFPDGMIRAISDIPKGGNNPFEYVKGLRYASNSWTLDENNERVIDITAPLATSISGFNNIYADFSGYCMTVFNIDIPMQSEIGSHTFKGLNYSSHMFIFNFPSGLRYMGESYVFYDIKNVVEINGEIDMSAATSIGTGCMERPINLEKIFFKNNSAKVMFSFNVWGGAPKLKDESLVSIANGLSESVSDQTLVLHPISKEKCSQITGCVEINETEEFYIFVISDSGDTTLEDFITSVKGWTLA